MDFTSIVTRLNELTTFMNNVVSLSKKIFQLPSSTTGNKLVAVWNESSEQTEQFNLTEAIQDMYTLTDGIKELGTVSNIGNDYIFSVGYKWRINGVNYENEETVLNVPDASTGFYRIDIAVVDETNSIYIVSGVESSTLALQPENPPNTLILCVFQIFEGVISNPDPVITQQNNIPLKINILSSDLEADTVTGFVTYFNALNPNVLIKETTSIVQFLCTDTNNIYQLTGVGKGTYGFGSLQITTNNVLKFSISGGAQNMSDVLTVGNRPIKLVDLDAGDYTFVSGDETKILYFYGVANTSVIKFPNQIDGSNPFKEGDEFICINGVDSTEYTVQVFDVTNISSNGDYTNFKYLSVAHIRLFQADGYGWYFSYENSKGITATSIDALKRDGSNANSNVDLGGYNLTANEVISSNRITGNGYYLINDGSGKVGLFASDTDKLIAVLDSLTDNIYKYGNGHLTYNETTNELKWDGNVIATLLDIPNLSGYATTSYVDSVASSKGDMFKSTYDTDDSGVVDNAEKMTTIGRNATGSTLYKGTIVYINGSTGNRPNFVKAQANAESTSAGTFGVVIADIANNTDGYVATIGTLSNLDTRKTATNPFTSDTLADGDTIYLSPTTAGHVTNIKPSAPNHLVYLGKVVKTNPTTGTIVYRVQNGYELDELHDVTTTNYTTPIDADSFLIYDSVNSLWKKLTLTNLKSTIKTYLDSFYGKKQDIITLTSAYMGSNTTSLQKAFNTGSSGTGSFNASANKMYRFTCELDLTGISSTTGTVAFGFLGTATISNINYKALGSKIASLATSATNTNYTTVQTTASTIVTASNTGTTARLVISGTIRVTTAGTIQPAYATSSGSSTVQTEPDSFFEIYEVGSNTLTATSNII